MVYLTGGVGVSGLFKVVYLTEKVWGGVVYLKKQEKHTVQSYHSSYKKLTVATDLIHFSLVPGFF